MILRPRVVEGTHLVQLFTLMHFAFFRLDHSRRVVHDFSDPCTSMLQMIHFHDSAYDITHIEDVSINH